MKWERAEGDEPWAQLRLDGDPAEVPAEPLSPAPLLSLVPGADTRRTMSTGAMERLASDRAKELRLDARHHDTREAALALAGPDARAIVDGRRGARYLALRSQAGESVREAQENAVLASLFGLYSDEHGAKLAPSAAASHAGKKRAAWWLGRLRGFLARPADCRLCGEELLLFRCQQRVSHELLCGARQTFKRRCDQRVLCEKCSMRRQHRDGRTHMQAITRLERSIAGEPHARQLRWKLLTVTVPDDGPVEERWTRLRAGVRRLRRLLRDEYIPAYSNLKSRNPCPPGGLKWFRGAVLVSFEVTEGNARQGHPHCHMLVLAPYIRPDWLRGDPGDDDDGGALKRAGLGPVSDIRAVKATRDDRDEYKRLKRNGMELDSAHVHAAVREVLKYVTKPLRAELYTYQRRTDGGWDRMWEPREYEPGERARTLKMMDRLLYSRRTVERCGLLRKAGVYISRVPKCPECGGTGCRILEAIWNATESANALTFGARFAIARAGPRAIARQDGCAA